MVSLLISEISFPNPVTDDSDEKDLKGLIITTRDLNVSGSASES